MQTVKICRLARLLSRQVLSQPSSVRYSFTCILLFREYRAVLDLTLDHCAAIQEQQFQDYRFFEPYVVWYDLITLYQNARLFRRSVHSLLENVTEDDETESGFSPFILICY